LKVDVAVVVGVGVLHKFLHMFGRRVHAEFAHNFVEFVGVDRARVVGVKRIERLAHLFQIGFVQTVKFCLVYFEKRSFLFAMHTS
jgi:mannose/fructose/N-acetylgalactosamine-specific phosphotransferase system component IIC